MSQSDGGDEPLFEKDLTRLKELERIVISDSSRFYDYLSEGALDIIPKLKEAIVYLRIYGEDDVVSEAAQFKALLRDFPDIVEKFTLAIFNNASESVAEHVLKEASAMSEKVREVGKQLNDSWVVEEDNKLLRGEVEQKTQMLRDKDRVITELEAQLENVREKEGSLRNELNDLSAKSATKEAGEKISKTWTNEYSKYIDADKTFVKRVDRVKSQTAGILARRKRAESLKWNIVTRALCKPLTRFRGLVRIYWIRKVKAVILYSGHSYVNMTRRWRFWRGFYFMLLLALALCYVGLFMNGEHKNSSDILNFMLQKLVFLPLAVMLSVGLIFSGRNYRIAANKLEDYRHNYIVACTLQNLMGLPEVKDGNQMAMLLERGVDTLFAHRPSGYMSKTSNEDETMLRLLIDKLSVREQK